MKKSKFFLKKVKSLKNKQKSTKFVIKTLKNR